MRGLTEPEVGHYWRVAGQKYLTLEQAAASSNVHQILAQEDAVNCGYFRQADAQLSNAYRLSASFLQDFADQETQACQGSRAALGQVPLAMLGAGCFALAGQPWVGATLGLGVLGVALHHQLELRGHQRQLNHLQNLVDLREGWAKEWSQEQLLFAGHLTVTPTSYLFESANSPPVEVRTLAQVQEQVFPNGPPLPVEREAGQVRYNGLRLPKKGTP